MYFVMTDVKGDVVMNVQVFKNAAAKENRLKPARLKMVSCCVTLIDNYVEKGVNHRW